MRRVARFLCVGLSVCLAAALAAAPLGAGAEEPLKFGLEYEKITAEFNDALKGKTGDLENYRAATAARDAAVTRLVKRAEEAKSQEHVPLAMAYNLLRRREDAAREARAALAVKKDFLTYTILIGAVSLDGKMDEAEKALAEAKEALGEKEQYVSLHQTIASAYQRLKRDEDAAGHIAEVLDGMWPSVVKTPDRYSKGFQAYLSQLSRTKLQAKNAAKILPILEKLEKRISAEAADNEKLETIAAELKEAKELVEVQAGEEGKRAAPGKTPAKTTARTVADTKKPGPETPANTPAKTPAATNAGTTTRTVGGNAAAAVTDEQVADAEKRLATDPKDKEALLTVLRGKRAKLRTIEAGDESAKLTGELNTFIDKNLETMADSPEFIGAASYSFGSAAYALISADKFDEGEKALKTWKTRLEGLKAESDDAKTAVTRAGTTIEQLLGRLDGARKRAALVGQPYFPIEEATWLNGSPLKPEELRGKVVLLDFWAVWCGPCIATFPHLKHWNEEYGDKGLVIIGVTNRYQFDWDAEAKRIKNVADLAPEKEDAATTQFVAHHGLKHRIAVMSEKSLSGKYLVTGIPQAVLIDRQGLIRVIKVGSGENNAKAMEAAIRQALDLPVAKASE